MYSAAWCSDCVYAKKYLDENNIHYQYVDVTNNEEATELVKKINRSILGSYFKSIERS